jgi:hypothetical protein
VIHVSLFKYWKGSLVEKQDWSSKVPQTIPGLSNPITSLLREGDRMNSIILQQNVWIFNFINPIHQLNIMFYLMKCRIVGSTKVKAWRTG